MENVRSNVRAARVSFLCAFALCALYATYASVARELGEPLWRRRGDDEGGDEARRHAAERPPLERELGGGDDDDDTSDNFDGGASSHVYWHGTGARHGVEDDELDDSTYFTRDHWGVDASYDAEPRGRKRAVVQARAAVQSRLVGELTGDVPLQCRLVVAFSCATRKVSEIDVVCFADHELLDGAGEGHEPNNDDGGVGAAERAGTVAIVDVDGDDDDDDKRTREVSPLDHAGADIEPNAFFAVPGAPLCASSRTCCADLVGRFSSRQAADYAAHASLRRLHADRPEMR